MQNPTLLATATTPPQNQHSLPPSLATAKSSFPAGFQVFCQVFQISKMLKIHWFYRLFWCQGFGRQVFVKFFVSPSSFPAGFQVFCQVFQISKMLKIHWFYKLFWCQVFGRQVFVKFFVSLSSFCQVFVKFLVGELRSIFDRFSLRAEVCARRPDTP